MTSYGQRRGFTLVELLVVVAIIGILAGLIMVGGSAAFRAARESATRMEMTNLERALEMYKTKYGEYPPDFSDYDAFIRHFKKRWSRVDVLTYFPTLTFPPPSNPTDTRHVTSTKAIQDAIVAATGMSLDPPVGNPTFDYRLKLSAIAFWLGGLPDRLPNTANPAVVPDALIGFGPSDNPLCLKMQPTNPPIPFNPPVRDNELTTDVFNNEKLREKPLYDFSVSLRNLPDNPSGTNGVGYRCLISGKPVAYFRGTSLTTRQAKTSAYLQDRTRGYDDGSGSTLPNTTKQICILEGSVEIDNATPYAMNTTPKDTDAGLTEINWHNANSFQLIHSGADDKFSDKDDRKITVTDEGQFGLKPEDLDNITNCGSSATIQGIIGK